MTTTAPSRTTSAPGRAPWVLLAGGLVALVGFLAGTGLLGGTSIGDVGGGDLGSDGSLVAPAGPAFSIWGPIYLGLVALAVWQVLPAHRATARVRAVTVPVLVSMLANTTWIVVAQAELTWVTPVVLAVIVGSLAVALGRLVRSEPASRAEAVLLDGTVGLYLGWTTVALVVNLSTSLISGGFADLAPGRAFWAVAVLAVAGAVGVAVTRLGRGRAAYPVAVTWALVWVVVARLTEGPPSSAAVVTAALAAAAVAVTGVHGVLTRRRRR